MSMEPEVWTPIDVSSRGLTARTGDICPFLQISSRVPEGEFSQSISSNKTYTLEVRNNCHSVEFYGVPVIYTEDGLVLALDKADRIVTKPAGMTVEWI